MFEKRISKMSTIDNSIPFLLGDQPCTDLASEGVKKGLGVNVIDSQGKTGLVQEYVLEKVCAGESYFFGFETGFRGKDVQETFYTLDVHVSKYAILRDGLFGLH
ncbi:hypothetical protein SNOG_20124 [Parastagonospora nodorum SN15]|uniref:Uncharacterized protein n=1 Tax=Phaeosphaeria nodorum (strain SN15 / ATCC MYA-4574 / FGSC 10173) TaxID=321614 RepID=A9JXC0_PHANO|nr:hypothetical protein SNOG_20124 [Parastagonospora nodorum SN15]EDP89810.1 hypothetical protein SNOG_20124 [Parastagonospora nodorum SN15]